MAAAYQAQGTDVASVTTTLALVAPATVPGDIIVANIFGNTNVAITLPDARWTIIQAFNNTAVMRHTVAFLRAQAGDSAATFNFGVVGTVVSYGILTTYRGAKATGTPVGASGQTATAAQDTVVYPAIQPVNVFSLIVACGTYALGATTAGAMTGTDPTFTNRVDLETATGLTASLFVYDGTSTGAAIASRNHTTTSTVDAINTGVFFELISESEVDDLGGTGGGGTNYKFPPFSRLAGRASKGTRDLPLSGPMNRLRDYRQY